MKIICVARNYAEHARELNNPLPDDPVIFLKPDTALLVDDEPFKLPSFSKIVHYETEIILKISGIGKNLEEGKAIALIDSISVGIDFTARDIQNHCKQKGLPWEIAKSFDGSAAAGKFIPATPFASLQDIPFHLSINGEIKQQGNTSGMIYSIDFLLCFISKYFTLLPGDLVYTGTPKGVGEIKKGDVMEGFIGNDCLLKCLIQ